jgi:Ca-activated chloride channel family protein
MRPVLCTLAVLAVHAAAYAGDLVPTDNRYGPLRVASHKIETTVDNQIAMTRVEQVFANDHPIQLEGIYIFPVPKGATIIDFSMTINGKLMRGELLEKQRARTIYEGIVRQAKDPGLLEHVGSNIFRVRVFPILPRSEQKIELTYLERVNYDSGLCRWTYPLLVPGSQGGTKTDVFSLKWSLESLVPITEVASPTHPVSVTRRTEASASVVFEGRNVDLSKDLEITYRLSRARSGMDLVAHRPPGREGTFLLLITPQADAPRLPKDMTFVFDTSGSMEGDRIKQARAALRFCLSKLGPEDRFNILSFSHDVTPFSPAHVPATPEDKERALQFVNALDASGSTNINGALLRALEHRPGTGRPHLILFLTDGEPTTGETVPRAILRNVLAANAANVRIFTFGVGNQVNGPLLEDLSENTRAVSEWVGEKENIEVKVSRLQRKVASPVISNLFIDWGQSEVSAVHPRQLGDLYAGTQLTVAGCYAKEGTFEVTLRGQAGPVPVEIRQKLTFPARRDDSQAVPYLWAMRKVTALLDEIRRAGENPELVQQVISLSRQYRIATPYTSFLVLETEAAYDQYGIERRGADFKPPAPVTAAPPRDIPRDTGKVTVPAEAPLTDRAADPGRAIDAAQSRFRKSGETADHNESLDDEEFQKAKGDSLDFVSDKPFKGKGTYDVLGAGGGGGGRYGGRFGGKRNLVARGGGSATTEDAVLSALKWLARHQNPDGSWSVTGYAKNCQKVCLPCPGEEEYSAGVTALSTLAFLGAGYTHLSRDTYNGVCFGDAVRKALQWMLSRQDIDGCIGSRNNQKYMYSHILCALAITEAYGLTGSNLFREQAQKAIDFIVAAQNPGKGWRYSYKCGDNDSSVTGWAVRALKSAEMSGLKLPPTAYDGPRAWFTEVTDLDNFRAGYTFRGTGKVFFPGRNEAFTHHETLTAIGILSRLTMNGDRQPAILSGGGDLLLKDRPKWDGNSIDFYYWYFGSQALFQLDGPAGPRWKAWNESMSDALVQNQNAAASGCKAGSWEPVDRWSTEGGRVYATAINAMTLETYYIYPRVMR